VWRHSKNNLLEAIPGNYDPVGGRSILPVTKVLLGLRMMAYGAAATAWMDYFQMSETTGRLCLSHLCSVISSDEALKGKYLKQMTQADAKWVSQMHEE
jgi:hypothetical protein